MTGLEEPKKSSRTLTATITLVAAILSLVAALGASAISLVALGEARDAKDQSTAAGPKQDVPVTQPTQTKPPVSASKSTSTAPPVLDERTVYSTKYTKQTLTMSAKCKYRMYADLDEPRSNVASNGADFVFTGGCSATDPAVFYVGSGADAGVTDNSQATPQECSDKIRTSPIGSSGIPVRLGVAICVTTSYQAARSQGDSWRVVLVVVTGVSDPETVTIEVSAWNIPT